MRKYFCILIILFLFVTGYVIPKTVSYLTATSEEITFDGYWWSTLNEWQKLGYIQGFIDAVNSNSPGIIYYLAFVDEEKISRDIVSNWGAFDKSFGYYMERIDGYYRTTKDLKKEIRTIMYDLMNPVPQ